jgi:hypothetical protein
MGSKVRITAPHQQQPVHLRNRTCVRTFILTGAPFSNCKRARHDARDPPATMFSFNFWSTSSTVRSISALGTPS